MNHRMLPKIMTCLAILSNLGAASQVFDHVDQPGLFSEALAVSHHNGLWYVVGDRAYGQIVSTAMLRVYDDTGAVVEEHEFWVPGNEVTFWTAMLWKGDTLMIGGMTSPGCDFGPFMGTLTAWHDGGDPLEQDVC